jgi:hypothetical protein
VRGVRVRRATFLATAPVAFARRDGTRLRNRCQYPTFVSYGRIQRAIRRTSARWAPVVRRTRAARRRRDARTACTR